MANDRRRFTNRHRKGIVLISSFSGAWKHLSTSRGPYRLVHMISSDTRISFDSFHVGMSVAHNISYVKNFSRNYGSFTKLLSRKFCFQENLQQSQKFATLETFNHTVSFYNALYWRCRVFTNRVTIFLIGLAFYKKRGFYLCHNHPRFIITGKPPVCQHYVTYEN